jgi:acyl carrier protein
VTPDELYAKLAQILDEDHIDANFVLRSSAIWDSLSVLAIVSFADESLGIPLHVSDLQKIQTAGELLKLLSINSDSTVHQNG